VSGRRGWGAPVGPLAYKRRRVVGKEGIDRSRKPIGCTLEDGGGKGGAGDGVRGPQYQSVGGVHIPLRVSSADRLAMSPQLLVAGYRPSARPEAMQTFWQMAS
jgi:hypothetical protein